MGHRTDTAGRAALTVTPASVAAALPPTAVDILQIVRNPRCSVSDALLAIESYADFKAAQRSKECIAEMMAGIASSSSASPDRSAPETAR